MRPTIRLLFALLLFPAGCIGNVPGEPPPGGEAEPDAGADDDQGDDGDGQSDDDGQITAALTGTVTDYFTATPLPGVALETVGLNPNLSTTSDDAGSYRLEVPTGVLFEVEARAADNYRLTVNPRVRSDGEPVEANVYAVSEPDALRQHSTVGLDVEPNTDIVIGELLKGDGTPKEGIPAASFSLVDGQGNLVGEGPYFFGEFGDVDPALQESTAFNGSARVAYLNVPAGDHTLEVQYPDDGDGQGGGGKLKTAAAEALGGGAVILRVNDKLEGGGGGDGSGGGQ